MHFLKIIVHFELRPRNSSIVQFFGLGLDGNISNLSFYQAHFILRSINIVDSLVPGLLSFADVITYYGVQKNENLKLVPGGICIFLRATSFTCELTRRVLASQLDTCVFFPFTPDPTPHSNLL